jgi:hypothetical protein
MNSKQLFQALSGNKKTEKCFDGIYSKDNLEDIVQKPCVIVCNTDPSSKPGKHWLLFYFEKDSVDFFDSLGKELTSYGKPFVNFVKRFSDKMNTSQVRTQPLNSDYCGQYCLFYALQKIVFKKSMEEILKMLQELDSSSVLKIVEKNFEFCQNFKCSLLQNCTKC